MSQNDILLKNLLSTLSDDGVDLKEKEKQISSVGATYAKNGDGNALVVLVRSLRDFFGTIPKARTAKIVRGLIDLVAEIPNTIQLQIELCNESIAWTRKEKRTFLRQRIEARLASLYLKTKDYTQSLALITSLLREVKKLDDKHLLVEIHLLESKVHHALRNIPKSRAALTAARTAANSIYCQPLLQAEIDMQSGTLHGEEKDHKTAYSYFYEAFENYNSLDHSDAIYALKYMLLSKIMTNQPEDVNTIINGKLKFMGTTLESMREISNACKNRSLRQFEDTLSKYSKELKEDPIVVAHLNELQDSLLDQNLCRIIEPYTCVEISYIAQLIQLDIPTVEKKLSQMILDKKFQGILDQGAGCLIVFDEHQPTKSYPAALETIQNLSKVVDSLFEKARSLQ